MIISFQLKAQKESNYWYFGYHAGLNFNTSPPTVLTDGAIYTDEGCASISSHSGKLQFYTDGITVWNRKHNVMPNGIGLDGNTSSTQSGVIVPFPDNPRYYYIFTTDCQEHHLIYGLRYSIVDMEANGGLGDIISKNNLLLTPACEKVTAIKHGTKRAYWLIAHKWNSDSFFTFYIDNNGVNIKSVISEAGTIMEPNGSDWGPAAGYLKASPNGNKIALGNNTGGLFEVFDFNDTTGVISNGFSFTNYANAYGLEFSPNGRFLYASSEYGFESTIKQYDLFAGSTNDIIYSGITLQHYTDPKQGTNAELQLGPDSQIYVTRLGISMLDIIKRPNLQGIDCQYTINGLSLNTGICRLGLPNLIKSYVIPEPFYYDDTCLNGITHFYIPDSGYIDSAWWNFDILSHNKSDSATGFSSNHQFTKTGIYTVRVTEFVGGVKVNFTRTLNITSRSIPKYNFFGHDSLICDSTIVLKTYAQNGIYKWQDGSTDSFYVVSRPGLYKVIITTPCGIFMDSINIAIFKENRIDFGMDTTLCLGDSFMLNAYYPMSTYQWQDGSSKTNFNVKNAGLYTVNIKNQCGTYTASKNVFTNDCNCYLFVPNAFTPNGDSLNPLFKPSTCEPMQYTMRIYNRWGEKLFETEDINSGWDGTFQHEKVIEGAYIYIIEARNWDKSFINRRGLFYVVYPKK